MITADGFTNVAKGLDCSFYLGVPCSYLTPLINHVIDSDNLQYLGATNEGDAVAIAAGLELGGRRSIVMFQNSGLGNAVNPLTSLIQTSKIPVLLILTLRGESSGIRDEPQHELMGKITISMLEMLEIPWEFFPTELSKVQPTLDRVIYHMVTHRTPYALVMGKGALYEQPLRSKPIARATPTVKYDIPHHQPSQNRTDVLRTIQQATRATDIIVATTGYIGRDLYACGDKENQFYMLGAMGCASSLGLGLALARPIHRVIVIDGDGAMLMRMGALATIGHVRPHNLIHIMMDNLIYESTGGQITMAQYINLSSIATACGYRRVVKVNTTGELENLLIDSGEGPTFIHVRINPSASNHLPRPAISPPEIAERLRRFIQRVS